MKKSVGLLIVLLLSSCSWFNRVPSGEKAIEGTFIYEDFVSNENCVSNGCKGDMIILRLKSGRSILAQVPTRALVKAFSDKRLSIPYKGNFKAQVIYDSMNRVDYLKLLSLDDQVLDMEVKAKDTN